MSSNAFNELAREYNERESRLEEIRERLAQEANQRATAQAAIRCPNACTEPCDYPFCRCHVQLTEADLDKAIAGSVVWEDTRTQEEIEADLRSVVCEACVFVDNSRGFFVDGATITPNTHYMRLDMKEPTPMSHDREPPPSTTWTDYILVALIAVGLGFAYVYWVVEEPAVAFTGEVAK